MLFKQKKKLDSELTIPLKRVCIFILIASLFLVDSKFASSQDLEITPEKQQYIDSLTEILDIINDSGTRASVLQNLWLNTTAHDLELAMKYADSLLSEHKRYNHCEKVLSLSPLVRNFYTVGEYYRAIQYSYKFIDISEECRDSTWLARIYNYMGMVFYEQGDIDKAINHYEKSIACRIDDPISDEGAVISYSNLAFMYRDLGKYDEAFEFSRLALRLMQELDFEEYKYIFPLSGIGALHLHLKHYDSAEYYFRKCFNKARETFDYTTLENRHTANYANCLADIYLAKNVLDSVVFYSNIALEYSRIYSMPKVQIDAYWRMVEIFERNALIDSAFFYQKLLLRSRWQFEKKAKNIDSRNFMAKQDFLKDSLRNAFQIELDQMEMQAKVDQERNNSYILLGVFLFLITIGVVVQREYARRRRLEAKRLKEVDEFKSRFFTNISHEFRTPLTVIQGVPDLLEQNFTDKSESKFKSNLQTIKRNSRRLLSLIEQILDLSKLEAGKLNLESKPYDLNEVVRIQLSAYHSYVDFKGLKIVSQYPDSKAVIDADLKALNHIIHNLVSNALKYTEKGSVQVKILEENDKVKLLIQDTGKGIKEENIQHIFDRYYRTDRAEEDGYEGTGLGLSLTKELINLLNAEIDVQSELGKGSVFTVIFARSAKEAVSVVPYSEDPSVLEPIENDKLSLEESEPDLDKQSILIVEDTADMQNYMVQVLEEEYSILRANNGREGLELAMEHTPDFIISDWMMPEMTGPEMIKELKSELSTSHIPVMLLTARADQESKYKGLSQGAEAYLTKPFDVTELKAQVTTLIEARKKLRSYLLNENGEETVEVYDADKAFIEKTLKFINDNLSVSELDRERLAEIHNISANQFYRKLKAISGEGVTQFVRKQRIKRAKVLLKEKRLTISEIAWETGFNDPAYFTRIFTNEEGVAPSEFKS